MHLVPAPAVRLKDIQGDYRLSKLYLCFSRPRDRVFMPPGVNKNPFCWHLLHSRYPHVLSKLLLGDIMLDGQECSRIYGLSGVLGIFASTVDDECLLVEFLCLPFIFISIISSFELFTAIFGITGPWSLVFLGNR